MVTLCFHIYVIYIVHVRLSLLGTSTPEEQQQRNREQWYAAGQQRPQQRSLTPILKRRTNDLSPISPTSDYSESQSSPRGRQMNSSNRTNVSGYESDNSLSPRFRSVSPYRQKSVQIGPVTEMVTKSDYYRHKDAHHNKVGDNHQIKDGY